MNGEIENQQNFYIKTKEKNYKLKKKDQLGKNNICQIRIYGQIWKQIKFL